MKRSNFSKSTLAIAAVIVGLLGNRMEAAVSVKMPPARIDLPTAKFSTGDDPARAKPEFDDGAWVEISTLTNYEKQGFSGYDGYSWYRFHVRIPSSLKSTVRWPQRLHSAGCHRGLQSRQKCRLCAAD